MKAYWGWRSIAPRILDLGTRWRLVVSFTPRPLCLPGKERHCMGGWVSPRSGRGGEEKYFQTLRGLEPPIVRPVAQRYTAELTRLLVIYKTI
jgi:hypothetical protein